MGHEIYRAKISNKEFKGEFSFITMADVIYQEYSAVTFALEIEIAGTTKSIIRLNPNNFTFKHWEKYNYYIFMICEEESIAKQVQRMENSDGKPGRFIDKARSE